MQFTRPEMIDNCYCDTCSNCSCTGNEQCSSHCSCGGVRTEILIIYKESLLIFILLGLMGVDLMVWTEIIVNLLLFS